MNQKGNLRRNIYSLLATLTIIAVLIIAGPVSAVRLNMDTDKGLYRSDDDKVVFKVGVDIQRGEAVPIQKLILNINEGYKVCEFAPDGTPIGGDCNFIDIDPINTGTPITDDLYGKGYGFVTDEKPRNQKTDFGYGYGFDEELHKSGYKGELSYEITWHMVADGAPDGRYSSRLMAYAENQNNNYTYITTSPDKFNLNLDNANPKATVTHRVTSYSNQGEIDLLGDHTTLDRENHRFSASLRHKEKDGVEGVTGVASATFSGRENGVAVRVKLTMRDFITINEFTEDKVDVIAMADVYHYSRYVPPVRERFEAPVRIVIENGDAVVTMDDSRLPVDATFDLNRYRYR